MLIDSKFLVDNIYAIAKEKGIKIGELESKAGITPGYLSRFLKKDVQGTPNLEVIANIAKELEVTIDNLLFDLPYNSETVKYWINTVKEIIKMTRNEDIFWERQTKGLIDEMTRENGYNDYVSNHPLFELVDYNDQQYMMYHSLFTGDHTMAYDSIYICEKGNNTFYAVKYYSGDKFDVTNYELYCVKNGKTIKLCNSIDKNSDFSLFLIMKDLYYCCQCSARVARVSEEAKEAIEDLLNSK